MLNFNQQVGEYLRLFGSIQRYVGDDLDRRSIQSYLNELAVVVETENIDALVEMLDDLKDWASDIGVD